MSSGFSANQYEGAFKSNKLQNWTLPKSFKERATVTRGHTTFIATDQGHLLSAVKRGNAWSSFKGTWDLPKRIPPVNINPTARSQEGQERLRTWSQCQPNSTAGMPNEVYGENRANNKAPQENNDQLHEEFPAPDVLVPETGRSHSQASQASSRPASQQSQAHSRSATEQGQACSRPATQQDQACSRPASQQGQACSRPASQQDQACSRPASQQGQACSRPASQQGQACSRPATQQDQACSRPATQQDQACSRPASQQDQACSRPASQNHSDSRRASKQIQA